MGNPFSRFMRIDVPAAVDCAANGKNTAFEISILADGEIPFPQVILYAEGREHLVKDEMIAESKAQEEGRFAYTASVPAGLVGPGEIGFRWKAVGRPTFIGRGKAIGSKNI